MKRTFIAALLAAPLLLCASCKEESSGANGADDNGGPKEYPTAIPSTDRFPAVAWHGVRAEQATAERFLEAEQMGITLNYSRLRNLETALKALDEAAKTNVKLIVECDELYNDEKRADAVRTLMTHKALGGYFMDDEPAPQKFEDIARRMREIEAIDADHICYCNIFPTLTAETYLAWGMGGYTDYVRKYIRTCQPKFLSFDEYPVHTDRMDGTVGQILVKGTWYPTLETARTEALRWGLDLWAFMLTCPHTAYPQPTTDHLRLQAYSDLAYGAQVLQCFTYWVPEVADNDFWMYRNAPIAEDGTRTETYDLVKAMLDEVQNVAWIFRGATVEGVWHTRPGGTIPDMTTQLTDLPECVSQMTIRDGSQALVSVQSNHGYRFMMLQNTDVVNPMQCMIRLKEGVRRVNRDGSVTLASEDEEIQTIAPGDVRIYMW